MTTHKTNFPLIDEMNHKLREGTATHADAVEWVDAWNASLRITKASLHERTVPLGDAKLVVPVIYLNLVG